MKRREVLKGALGAVVAGSAAGCGNDGSGVAAEGDHRGPPLPAHDFGDAQPTPTPTPVLSPEELLAGIDTFVVLMMENRSFDHFLGSLSLAEGRAVKGLTGFESNLSPEGEPISPFVLDDFTPEDPPHGWDSVHRQWNEGAMDNFVKEHAGPSQNQVMGYHTRGQLPTIYQLADAFAVCDAWHCSVLGPTWPNRYYLHGGTSMGKTSNDPVVGFTSIFNLLKDANVPSRTYFHDLPFQGGYFNFDNLSPVEQFFQDAASGTLPAFTMLEPKFSGADANDDHPDHDVQLGQALIASVYSALTASPQWGRCLFVVTYDEHGGFFDHVPPPPADDERAEFRRHGIRVPAIVAGPMVKAGATVSHLLEHTSVLATLGKRFGIPPVNQRVAAANDLSVCIDPAIAAGLIQPMSAPRIAPVTVSLSKLAAKMARPFPRNQPELQDLADRRELPRHLDRRRDGAEVTRRVLEAGRRVGGVRLVR